MMLDLGSKKALLGLVMLPRSFEAPDSNPPEHAPMQNLMNEMNRGPALGVLPYNFIPGSYRHMAVEVGGIGM
jgi:hypothetical protein